MTWDYRVLKEGDRYWVGEVYYDGDTPEMYSGPFEPYGESPDELKDDLEKQLRAFDKEILEAW